MTTDFHLYVNEVELTPPLASASNAVEWDATWEERIDGVGAASVTIQDRGQTLNYGRQRDVIRMTVDTMAGNLFWGEITRSRLDLPPGRSVSKWKATCSDWNALLDLRLVGIPRGNHWTTDDGGRTHYPVDIYNVADPYDAESHSWPTDRETIHRLFVSYIRLPAPDLSFIDAQTYVKNYLPKKALWINGEPRIHWDRTTLRGVMDELRGYAQFPLFYWIDPDLYLHWTLLPDPTVNRAALGLPAMFPTRVAAPSAPAIVADDLSGPGTRIGGRELFMEYDGSYMPQRAYITGVTDFIYNGGSPIAQGTGLRSRWMQGTGGDFLRRRTRHVLVDAQATTTNARDSVAGHYERYGERARVKGSVTVAGRPDEMVDGWRVGQLLTVIDARLPDSLNGRAWPIQRVSGRLVPAQNLRKYTLEFGDAPIERFSQKFQQVPHKIHHKHHPAREHQVIFPTANLRPSTTYLVRSQLVDHSKRPLRQGGVPVTWAMTVLSSAGAPVSTGTLTPNRTTTNRHGETTADLVTGSGTDLHYNVTCRTAAQ